MRLLAVLALLTLALLGWITYQASTADARGCRASGGTWHLPQQSCTWDQP